MRIIQTFTFAVLGAAGLASTAAANTVVDLSTTPSGSINNALFENFNVRPAGTGVINSFLRIQNSPTEQGYNTSGRPLPFDENNSPNFTRNVMFSDLATRTVNGTDYFEFLLDTNEPNGGGENLITLDKLQLYTNATGSLTTTNLSQLGALRYDLDAGMDNSVIINDTLSSGSGQSDVRILIPTSTFTGTAQSDFVYLYAMFNNSQGGFEEFFIQGGGATMIPLPTVGAMGLAGLTGLVTRRGRSKV